MKRPLAIAAVLGALAACGGAAPQDNVPEPRLSSIQEMVLNRGCTFGSCHDQTTPAAKCDLTAGNAWTTLVDKRSSQSPERVLVVPGNPEDSFLIAKLRGTLGATEGERMPLRNPPLDEETIQTIEAWIASGAPND